jgi:hypothetical protein
VRLAGEDAIAFDLAAGADGLQSRQVAAMRDGQLLFVGVTAPKAQWGPTLRVFDRLLGSWEWGTVSA